nr:HNH endonuclease [uncultured Cellulosilyticum sp.]
MNWIIPANVKTYDVLSAFAENKYIDWRQNANFAVGDTVYIYVSRPYQKIMFKTEVVCINLDYEETIDDRKYWVNQEENEDDGKRKYMRLRLEKKSDSELLNLESLIAVGMKSAPQSATKLNEDIVTYVEQNLETQAVEQETVSVDELNRMFDDELKKAKTLSRAARDKRLLKASRRPDVMKVVSSAFRRNPDVVIAVLERANGVCERCGMSAPFIRVSDGTPYLEVHHKVRLADGGEDTVENAIAVCPNCHRELHFGV